MLGEHAEKLAVTPQGAALFDLLEGAKTLQMKAEYIGSGPRFGGSRQVMLAATRGIYGQYGVDGSDFIGNKVVLDDMVVGRFAVDGVLRTVISGGGVVRTVDDEFYHHRGNGNMPAVVSIDESSDDKGVMEGTVIGGKVFSGAKE